MNVVEINIENAKDCLIDESFKRIVVIGFWAEKSAPCKGVMSALEKLANQFSGTFLYAKVNTDEMGMIASQFGVRSLPTVIVMKDGQPIDGFADVLVESQIRTFLEKHLPKPWEKFLTDAKQFMEAGDYKGALPLLRSAFDESKHLATIACLLAEANLELNRLDSAEQILSTIKMVDQDTHYQQLLAQLELKKQAAKSPDLVALEAAHEANPNDLEICFQLAVQYNQEQAYRPALELLIDIIRKERNFGNGLARKILTDILVALGKGDPLAIEFQRKLFTLLY